MHNADMYKTIKETAEKILGRPLKPEEGISQEEIETAEKRLRLKLPELLREFYLEVGNLTVMTNATERFYSLDQLACIDDKLVFVEEQKGNGYWGINIKERYNKDATVFYCVEENNGEKRIWFNEGIGLKDFVHSTMYYQCAQATYEYNHFMGNYSFTGALPLEKGEDAIKCLIEKLNKEWEKVVNRTNLVIYWRDGQMIWFFTTREGKPDEMVMLSSQTEEGYVRMLKEFGFFKEDKKDANASNDK